MLACNATRWAALASGARAQATKARGVKLARMPAERCAYALAAVAGVEPAGGHLGTSQGGLVGVGRSGAVGQRRRRRKDSRKGPERRKPDLCGGVASGGWGGDRTSNSHPAPEDFAPADPKIFLQHKMPGPPEAPAPCVFQISPIARYVFWPNPRSRANSLRRVFSASETVRLIPLETDHNLIGT